MFKYLAISLATTTEMKEEEGCRFIYQSGSYIFGLSVKETIAVKAI